MEKLPMCRMCLAEDARMYVVVNNLRQLYEKLTDNPFVTEDSRPMLACYFCCTKLKQCYQFQRKCLEAEELFAQMMNEGYVSNPLMNQEHPKFWYGFSQSPIEHINIVGECQTERVAIKEELQDDSEGLDNIFAPKEEHETDELELENQDNSFSDVEDVPAQHSESDSEDDVPLLEYKIDVEEHEVLRNKRSASDSDTQRASAKKPKLEEVIAEEQKNNEQSETQVIRTTEGSLTIHMHTHSSEKPYKCDVCSRTFNQKGNLTKHMPTHTGDKPYKCDVCQQCFIYKTSCTRHIIRTHSGEKSYKCDVCRSSFNDKSHLTSHMRTHTGEKPYKCNVCSKTFSQKGTLTKHMRTHTGEKPYKCDKCQRSFSWKDNLTKHMRTHTGDKPYKCDLCQSSFTRNFALKNHHIRKHSGRKC